VESSDPDSSALRRIDDALVPRLQRGTRAVVHTLGWPGRSLRALDDRLAGGRPARAVRTHRGLATFLIVALAFGAVAVHAQRYPALQERARQARGDGEAPVGDDGQPTGTPGQDDPAIASAVGPPGGSRVDTYVADRDEVIASAAPGEVRGAVVSFTEFLEPGEVASVVGDVQVHRVQYRLPERTPRPTELEVDDGDLVAAVEGALDRLVADLRAEEDEVASTLASGVEDEEFRADYEARLDELEGLRDALASEPAIVFAVVVSGRVAALQDLGSHASVRLVDLAPSDTEVGSTAFFGLLPTDRDRVSFGRPA